MKKRVKNCSDEIAAALLLAGCITIGDEPWRICLALAMLAGAWIAQRCGGRT